MPDRKKIFVPPGGFMGFVQQSVATQALIQGQGRRKTKKKRATKKRAAKKSPRRKTTPRKTGAKKKPARMVKGSAAAKRHMKKIRNMRK